MSAREDGWPGRLGQDPGSPRGPREGACAHDRSAHDRSARHLDARDQGARDRSAHDRSARHLDARDQGARDRSARDHSARHLDARPGRDRAGHRSRDPLTQATASGAPARGVPPTQATASGATARGVPPTQGTARGARARGVPLTQGTARGVLPARATDSGVPLTRATVAGNPRERMVADGVTPVPVSGGGTAVRRRHCCAECAQRVTEAGRGLARAGRGRRERPRRAGRASADGRANSGGH